MCLFPLSDFGNKSKPAETGSQSTLNSFMEKCVSIRNTQIIFSIWDLGGQREFVNMLPLVCNDAVAILFMFDLSRKSTLNSIKEWYRQARGFNKTAIPFLVSQGNHRTLVIGEEVNLTDLPSLCLVVVVPPGRNEV